MHRLGEWLRRVRYLLNRRRLDDALTQEMEAHRAAMGRPAAFGNTLRLREEARDVWGWMWLDNAARDLRFAVRALRRTPGFTLGAVCSLALGLALATSAVAVVNAYLLRSLPYPAADRVYHVMYAPPGPWEPRGIFALDWTSVKDVVEFPIASTGETFFLADGNSAQPARGRRVTYGVVQGVGVVLGRMLVENDFHGGAAPSALIGYNLWRDRFGSSPDAVGRELLTDSEAAGRERFRIVGVLSRDFYVGGDNRQSVDVVVPLSPVARRYYMVRLRAGVPPDVAERRIGQAVRAVATDLPPDWSGVHLESAHDRYLGDSRPVLIGVTVAASLVLIIVCANVAVLVLLRATRRHKEIALRLALGSGRTQIARMLAAESGLICAAALAIALVLTHLGLGLLAPLIEAQLGRAAPAGPATIAVDPTVLLIVGVAGTVMALGLAFVPLLFSWQGRIADVLRRTGTTTTDSRSTGRLRSGLLAFEVAGTLILLVGCGLMIRSVATMVRTDLGFQPEQLVRARVELRAADYADAAAFSHFYERFTSRVSTALAGPVVFSSWPPFAAFPEQALEIDGLTGHVLKAGAVTVGAGYLTTFGIALRSGRDIMNDDLSASAPVAVVSETLARRLWPAGTPLGKQLRQIQVTAGGPLPPGPWRTVVGVAADVRQAYADTNLSDVYTPGIPTVRFGTFYVRTSQPETSLLPALRSLATEIDPHAMVDLLRPVEGDNRELAGTSFLTAMLTGFAALAAFIAVLGIYGVTAYAAEQREREVAIRVALGAGRDAIVRLFLREGVLLLAAGLIVGLIGAIAAARVLEHQVFAVRAFDIATLLTASALLAAATLLAIWWPARRASRRNPIAALKDG